MKAYDTLKKLFPKVDFGSEPVQNCLQLYGALVATSLCLAVGSMAVDRSLVTVHSVVNLTHCAAVLVGLCAAASAGKLTVTATGLRSALFCAVAAFLMAVVAYIGKDGQSLVLLGNLLGIMTGQLGVALLGAVYAKLAR